jgi:hypothetical protein
MILFSCQEKEEIPDYLWEDEKFVEVLTEFQITESIIRLGYHRFPDSAFATDSIYASMYSELGVTEAEFDSNYQYHLKDPESLSKIYGKVITNLSERSAELSQKDD